MSHPFAHRRARWLRLAMVLLAALLAGWALQQVILWWRAPASADTAPGITGAPTQAAAIQAWLVVGDAAHSLGGSTHLSLPSGTRFQLRLRSGVAGQLTLSTRNPAGQLNTVPLWQDFVSAGAELTSPNLRLDGAKGRETLVVTVTPHKGLPQSVTLHLWHM